MVSKAGNSSNARWLRIVYLGASAGIIASAVTGLFGATDRIQIGASAAGFAVSVVMKLLHVI